MPDNLFRRVASEFLGTAMLLAAIVGSGVMADRLSIGNTAIALLANTVATAGALIALILTFGGISGAHFSPVVTLCDAWQDGISWRDAAAYIPAQIMGAIAGVVSANVMFDLPIVFASTKVRTGASQWFSEFVSDVWLANSNLGLRPTSQSGDCSVRGRCVYNCGLLVHGVNVVR